MDVCTVTKCSLKLATSNVTLGVTPEEATYLLPLSEVLPSVKSPKDTLEDSHRGEELWMSAV